MAGSGSLKHKNRGENGINPASPMWYVTLYARKQNHVVCQKRSAKKQCDDKLRNGILFNLSSISPNMLSETLLSSDIEPSKFLQMKHRSLF